MIVVGGGGAIALSTAQELCALQGLRPVHRRGHIVICGAGSIGSGVIDLLLALGKKTGGRRVKSRQRGGRKSAGAAFRAAEPVTRAETRRSILAISVPIHAG